MRNVTAQVIAETIIIDVKPLYKASSPLVASIVFPVENWQSKKEKFKE